MTKSNKVMGFLKKEFYSVLPPVIYFFVCFNIIGITTSIMLKEFSPNATLHLTPTLHALVIGKVVLVVDEIKHVRWLDSKPLAYPVLFRSVVYTLCILLFVMLEHWALSEEIQWLRTAISQFWIFVLFLVYFSFKGLMVAFGLSRRDLLRAFFLEGPPGAAPAS